LKAVAAFTSGLALALAALAPTAGASDAPPTVQIVSALYGAPHASRPYDFSQRLAATCGADATSCEAFCTPAGTGARRHHRWAFGARPICRVVYRCSDGRTKATEASEDDTIFLGCAPPR
jgi:hypothetical protein